MFRRTALYAGFAIVLVHVAVATPALAYSVAVRWIGSDDPSTAGYRLYVRPAGSSERPPIDVPRPRHDASGRFRAVVRDLDVETTYTFALSAYSENGEESERSNEHSLGYAQAATVVDSDYDGLTDAAEDANLNLLRDAGETDRSSADTDGDGVPDGLEVEYGADPMTPGSPSCEPLAFASFRTIGPGTVDVVDDDGRPTLVTTSSTLRSTSFGVTYPRQGVAAITSPLLVMSIRDDDAFRVEVRARSTAGKLYRLRYVSRARVFRWRSRRRLSRALGDHFTLDRAQPLGFDIAAEIARLDPRAVFAAIERITVRGDMLLGEMRVCR